MANEMNSIDLKKVAEFLTDEIEILSKYSMKPTIQPADLNHIITASERIGVATKLILKRVARIEDFLQIPESFE